MLYLCQKVYWRMNESLQMLNEPTKNRELWLAFFWTQEYASSFISFSTSLHLPLLLPPPPLPPLLSPSLSSSPPSSPSPSSSFSSSPSPLSLSSHQHHLHPHPHHVGVSAECRRGHRGEECAAAGEDEVVQTAQILCGHGEGGRTEADTADGWGQMDRRQEGWMWAHERCVVVCWCQNGLDLCKAMDVCE